MNPTENSSKLEDKADDILEGSIGHTSVLPLAIACLSTGLFLGSFFTKKAPISLVISSA